MANSQVLAVMLIVTLVRPVSAQPASIRDQLRDYAIGGRMTVHMCDGRDLHGNLSAIDTDFFTLREVDLKATFDIRYDEVRSIEKNYGRPGFGGRRVSPRKQVIGAVIVLGLIFTLVGVVALTKD
jgi:hypothetical protein